MGIEGRLIKQGVLRDRRTLGESCWGPSRANMCCSAGCLVGVEAGGGRRRASYHGGVISDPTLKFHAQHAAEEKRAVNGGRSTSAAQAKPRPARASHLSLRKQPPLFLQRCRCPSSFNFCSLAGRCPSGHAISLADGSMASCSSIFKGPGERAPYQAGQDQGQRCPTC
jgi:hypothetical protein